MGAIFIPSNRIFNIENDKILENVIDKVEIEVGKPVLRVQDDYNIENVIKSREDIKSAQTSYFYDNNGNLVYGTTQYQELTGSNSNIGDKIEPFFSGDLRVRAYCAMTSMAFIPIKIVVPYDSEKISVPYPAKDIKISYSLACETTTHKATVSAGSRALETTTTALRIISVGEKISTSYISNQPTEVSYTYTAQKYGYGEPYATCTAKLQYAKSISLDDGGTYTPPNLPTIGAAASSDGKKYFTVEFYIPYYVGLVQAGYDELYSNITEGFTMDGTTTTYVPTSITISVQGKAYVLDIPTETQSYGSGENIYSISNNELIQATNFYVDTTTDDNATQDQIKLLCNNILDEYKYGKEKAVIECAVSDYYDENGNKVIDAHSSDILAKQFFSIGDEVIPFVYKGSKVVEPLSRYSDGTMKIFKVVSNKIEYKGAPFQTLTLQEIKQKSN